METAGVVFWFESFPAMATFQSPVSGFPKLIFQTTGTFFLSAFHARILAFAGSLFRLYPCLLAIVAGIGVIALGIWLIVALGPLWIIAIVLILILLAIAGR